MEPSEIEDVGVTDIFQGYGVEVLLTSKEDFLKVVETLTRIGVLSKAENKLIQSCNLLHKRGRYRILHFKEMLGLDGNQTTFCDDDAGRRNRIVLLLQQWKLLKLANPEETLDPVADLSKIKVIPFAEKSKYLLVSKYSIGKKKKS